VSKDRFIREAVMDENSKIYVVGHRGMVGSAIIRKLEAEGYHNIITRTSKELDLRRQDEVEQFFSAECPEYVFLAAAKVGGIIANSTYPADFMYDNLMIEMNVIKAAFDQGVKKLMFLGSSCIYPRMAPQPMPESCLLTSELEKTNEAYALAKISGLKYCEYLNKQYGTDYISVMPTNLYGPNDNYHPENSHVLPALIRRFHEAKTEGIKSVTIWGTGTPLREFLYVDDLADGCIYLMNNYFGSETVNLGTGKEISISELAATIKKVVGYKGEIIYDTTKPDGTPRKLLDVSKLEGLGWRYKTELEDGIMYAYRDFITNEIRAER
jgi:GDP-L-fucose synthase